MVWYLVVLGNFSVSCYVSFSSAYGFFTAYGFKILSQPSWYKSPGHFDFRCHSTAWRRWFIKTDTRHTWVRPLQRQCKFCIRWQCSRVFCLSASVHRSFEACGLWFGSRGILPKTRISIRAASARALLLFRCGMAAATRWDSM